MKLRCRVGRRIHQGSVQQGRHPKAVVRACESKAALEVKICQNFRKRGFETCVSG